MKEIELSKGHQAIIDDEDYEYLNQFKWHFDGRYAARTIWNKETKKESKVYMHRIIIESDGNLKVDHINNNKLDNRKSNLRIVTDYENARNQSTQKRKKSSRYKGVCFVKDKNKFKAYIKTNGKLIHLGYSDDEKECALLYNKKALELFGEFSKLNEID